MVVPSWFCKVYRCVMPTAHHSIITTFGGKTILAFRRTVIPFGGPTHERLAPVDDESPQTTSSGDVWAQIQHGTCNSSANATGFDRALTYSPPFFVRAHQTTKEDCTPGTLKASQVALVEPVAYLKDLVISGARASSAPFWNGISPNSGSLSQRRPSAGCGACWRIVMASSSIARN